MWAWYSVVFVCLLTRTVCCLLRPKSSADSTGVFPARPPSDECRRRLNLSVGVHNCSVDDSGCGIVRFKRSMQTSQP